MANEFNTGRTAVETILDHLLGAHTDTTIASFLTNNKYNPMQNSQIVGLLLMQIYDRIETLEAP